MTYPTTCAKCGKPLGQTKGRPTRWCSTACRLSGEAEIRRLNKVLAQFELGRAADVLNNYDVTQRDVAIAEVTARLDRLYGVATEAGE